MISIETMGLFLAGLLVCALAFHVMLVVSVLAVHHTYEALRRWRVKRSA